MAGRRVEPWEPVDVLASRGLLSQSQVRLVKNAGIATVARLASLSAAELAATINQSEDVARRILSRVWRAIGYTIRPAIELKRAARGKPRVTSGSSALDRLIGGGFEPGVVYELFGEYGAGKTQICHQLAVNVQLPPGKGGLGARAVYIDTEGTFRWERVARMAEALGLDPDQALDNIIYIRAVNSHHQVLIVEELLDKMAEYKARLVIVDSVTSHFRADFPGRENLPTRQQLLNRHLHQLARIADLYNAVVVVTNQVMSKPDAYFNPNDYEAVGGHVLYHAPGVRIQLKKARGKMASRKRIARVVDAPHIPEAEAVFAITDDGIRDVEE